MPYILLGPLITNCKLGSDRCTNCKHLKPSTKLCEHRQTVIESPETTTCMRWLDKDGQAITKEPTVSLTDHVEKCLVSKERGYRRGYMIAELYMMCNIACQFMPNMESEWKRLTDILEDALRMWWAKNDMDKEKAHE